MVELIPFLLFLLEWHPERPDQIAVTRVEQVFVDETACETAGNLRLAEEIARRSAEQVTLDFHCQPLPPREEFEAMLEREFGEGSE